MRLTRWDQCLELVWWGFRVIDPIGPVESITPTSLWLMPAALCRMMCRSVSPAPNGAEFVATLSADYCLSAIKAIKARLDATGSDELIEERFRRSEVARVETFREASIGVVQDPAAIAGTSCFSIQVRQTYRCA